MTPAATVKKLVLLVLALLALTAHVKANELWVAPAKSPADKLVADFAVAQKKTHFGFGVPDNFTGFSRATLLLIGSRDQEISYDLTLSISQNLGSARAFVTETRGIPATVLRGQLLELDVSAIFAGAPALQAGTDYVSLSVDIDNRRMRRRGDREDEEERNERHPEERDDDHFKNTDTPRALLFGLRFQYEGSAGPQGPAGPKGEKGDPGPQGPPGTLDPAVLAMLQALSGPGLTLPTLPAGTSGGNYDQALQLAGGTGPFQWSIVSGQLPPGLTLDKTTGRITGSISSTVAGSFDVVVQVVDANGRLAQKTYSVVVQAGGGGSLGPDLTCVSPAAGTMIQFRPGDVVTFTGRATDVDGVAQVTVNGTERAIGPDGSFSAPVVTRFGVNFVAVGARDARGTESRRTCAFLVADTWAREAQIANDLVVLRLAQSALDDGSRTPAPDDFADVLFQVLNSQGLRDTLHAALLQASPLKPKSCDKSEPIFNICLLSSEVRYLSSSLPGPNAVSVTLVDGGVHVSARIENPSVRLLVDGSELGIPYSVQGDVLFDYIDVQATYDLGLVAGRPRATIRANSVAVQVGAISLSFSGLGGDVLQIVTGIANGVVRDLVATTIRGFTSINFSSVLDGLFSGLDLDHIPSSLSVPRLEGTGQVTLFVNPSFSSASVTPARLLFGLGMRLTSPAVQSRPSLGAPLPPGLILVDPSAAGRPVAVAVHVGYLNQFLHALWRGGYFDATIQTTGGGLVALQTALPPVVSLRDSSALVFDIGPVDATVSLSGQFDGLRVELGARSAAPSSLQGEDLALGDVNVEELYVSAPSQALADSERLALEDLLRPVVVSIVEKTIEAGLPALPIPVFRIPSSLSIYGLPAGGAFGMMAPTLSGSDRHLILRGDFGVRQ